MSAVQREMGDGLFVKNEKSTAFISPDYARPDVGTVSGKRFKWGAWHLNEWLNISTYV
ncbi:hypothetical protein [Pseudomonas sp. 5P_5.1_Bac1]|uniref:hypothetical protein n=1 Tax=Pseudomonas sp. 5P_5.1_Bac1 TaxID=2971616 RepID=UPI0021C7BA44|nr:hypothetical protein [Pseudomonas sp. 5P_5.1_Bac1]MCU1721504.1 hypothetical protein [Pseudomonas sp. 5P_5.1_Bac1]